MGVKGVAWGVPADLGTEPWSPWYHHKTFLLGLLVRPCCVVYCVLRDVAVRRVALHCVLFCSVLWCWVPLCCVVLCCVMLCGSATFCCVPSLLGPVSAPADGSVGIIAYSAS